VQIQNSVSLITGLVVGLFALLVILIILLYLYRSRVKGINMDLIPEEVRWYFDESRIKTENWTVQGALHTKKIMKEKKSYYSKLKKLLVNHLEGEKILPAILSACAVYNKVLVNNFVGAHSIIVQRHANSPKIFKKDAWKQKNDGRTEHRLWVEEMYQQYVKSIQWNKDTALPIVPVVHGTDGPIAQKIIDAGLTALSTFDEGYYGKGIYFTSSCLYALPYYAAKPEPSLLVCLIVPGNPLPIIEGTNEAVSYIGKPVDAGYQSHFVCCGKEGQPSKTKAQRFFTEFVIPQDSQVVPIYMLHLKRAGLKQLIEEFKRSVPSDKRKSHRDDEEKSKSSQKSSDDDKDEEEPLYRVLDINIEDEEPENDRFIFDDQASE